MLSRDKFRGISRIYGGLISRALEIMLKACWILAPIAVLGCSRVGGVMKGHSHQDASIATPPITVEQRESDDAIAAKLIAAKELPKTFKELGLFTTAQIETPLASLYKYNVKVPLWSDGATKTRFIYVPSGSNISFDDKTQKLVLPRGSILIKHFASQDRPVETRVLVYNSDGKWLMATYQWNGSAEATRVDAPAVTPVGTFGDSRFRLPSPDECKLCHSPGNGVVLGFQPDQLNAAAHGSAVSPLQELAALPGVLEKLFAPGVTDHINDTPKKADPSDPTLSASLRARAYIDVNCAPCHNPSSTQGFIDLSLATGLHDEYPAILLKFDRVVPGSPSKSYIFQKYIDPLYRMPPLSRYPDPLGQQLLQDWITQWPVPATTVGSGTSSSTGKGTTVNVTPKTGTGSGTAVSSGDQMPPANTQP